MRGGHSGDGGCGKGASDFIIATAGDGVGLCREVAARKARGCGEKGIASCVLSSYSFTASDS